MRTLTIKIPDELDAALRAASARRQIRKSELVRRSLQAALDAELQDNGAADRWVARWRGSLIPETRRVSDSARLQHLLGKHVK